MLKDSNLTHEWMDRYYNWFKKNLKIIDTGVLIKTSELYKWKQSWVYYNMRGETTEPFLDKTLNMPITDL